MTNYWNQYNPATDFDSLSAPTATNQSRSGSTFGLQRAGYDPVWVWETYGDRLSALPPDLRDAVFEAMRQGTILSPQWAENVALFIPEFLG